MTYDSPTQLQPSEIEALRGASADTLPDVVRRIVDQRTHALVSRVTTAEAQMREMVDALLDEDVNGDGLSADLQAMADKARRWVKP